MESSTTQMQSWIGSAETKEQKKFRKAVHIILHAMAVDQSTRANFVLKGGILLALKFESNRFTKDIDLSCVADYSDFDESTIKEILEKSLKTSAMLLNYDLECVIQKIERKPNPQKHPKPKFPALQIKIGYTDRAKLRNNRPSANVVAIDISYNEVVSEEKDYFSQEIELNCYSLRELISEKIRSILQQVERNRTRRQDIFDLYHLIQTQCENTDEEKADILKMLFAKSVDRGIDAFLKKDALDNQEIKNRSKKDYLTLETEVSGVLPDFDTSYEVVNNFFKSLPWEQEGLSSPLSDDDT